MRLKKLIIFCYCLGFMQLASQNQTTFNVNPLYLCSGTTDDFVFELTFNAPFTNTVVGSVSIIAPSLGGEVIAQYTSALLQSVAGNVFLTITKNSPGKLFSISRTFSATANYTVSVNITSSSGSITTITKTVNIVLQPSISPITLNSPSICAKETAVIVPTSTATISGYTWMPTNINTKTIAVSPLSTSIYTLIYTSGSCLGMASTTVAVNDVTISVLSTTALVTQTVNVTTNTNRGGGFYQWSMTVSSIDNVNLPASDVSTRNYTVTYHYTNPIKTCVITVTGAITVVTVNILLPSYSVCVNQLTTITPTISPLGGNYLWQPGNQTTPHYTLIPTLSNQTFSLHYTIGVATATASGSIGVSEMTIAISPSSTCLSSLPATVLLTSSTNSVGGTYNWMPGGEITANIIVTPNIQTTYTLSYSHSECVKQSSSVVSINQMTLGATPFFTLCTSKATDLGVSTNSIGGTYTILPINTITNNISLTPTANTTYTINYSYLGCLSSTTSAVSLNQTTISVNVPTICLGQTVSLTCLTNSLGGVYNWAPDGQSTSSIVTSPTTQSTYTLSYDYLGCLPQQTITVGVNQMSLSATPVFSMCVSTPTNLGISTNSVGGTYTILPINTVTSSVLITPTAPSTYTVQYEYLGCLRTVTSSILNVNQTTLNVNSFSMCLTNTANLVAFTNSVGGSYNWVPGGETTNSIVISPSVQTTYTINYTFQGCTKEAVSTITVNQMTLSAANQIELCLGNTTDLGILTNSIGGLYTLQPLNTVTSNVLITPSLSNTYTISYAYLGCVNSQTCSVAVHNVTLSVNSVTVCSGESTTISANTNSLGGTYSWLPSGSTDSWISITPTVSSTFSVTYNYLSCSKSATGSLLYATPSVAVLPYVICQGNTITLTPTVSPLRGKYLWQPFNLSDSTAIVSPNSTTNYTLTYNYANCLAVASSSVRVKIAPTLAVSSASACQNKLASIVASISPLGGDFNWLGYPTVTGTVLALNLSNSAYIGANYDYNGCAKLVTGFIQVFPLPVVDIISSELLLIPQESTTLTVYGAASYTWSTGAKTQTINFQSPITGDVCVMATNIHGCVTPKETCITVNVIEVPVGYIANAFTPNNDEINDFFEVQFLNVEKLRVRIYNIQGGLTYESIDPKFKWDGKKDGVKLPIGTYYYILNIMLTNKHDYIFSGHVSLIR